MRVTPTSSTTHHSFPSAVPTPSVLYHSCPPASVMSCRPRLQVLGGILAFLSLSVTTIRAADNTACLSGELDWYINVVGETPCMTYQRLQQICWDEYEVPVLARNPPGTICHLPGGRIPDCCCNSVSWFLSMLCLNCQYTPLGANIDTLDPAAYTAYLSGCAGNPPDASKALPINAAVQNAICHRGIRIDNYLYGFPWGGGIWYYGWTSSAMQEEHAKDNNQSFTHCPNDSILPPPPPPPIGSSSVITSAQSDTPPPSSIHSIITSDRSNIPPPSSISSTITSGRSEVLPPASSSNTITTSTRSDVPPASSSSIVASTQSDNPSSTTVIALSSTGNNNSKPAIGIIVGGVVGGLVALLAIGVGCFVVGRRRGPHGRRYDDSKAPITSSALSTSALTANYPRSATSASTDLLNHTGSPLIFHDPPRHVYEPFTARPSYGDNSSQRPPSTFAGSLGGPPPAYPGEPSPSASESSELEYMSAATSHSDSRSSTRGERLATSPDTPLSPLRRSPSTAKSDTEAVSFHFVMD